jgi:hypothetical protein
MRRSISLLAGILVAFSTLCLAQEFKPYPGAKLDDKTSREASATVAGKQSEVYTTSDSLDKVYAFYKGIYKEFFMATAGPTLPSGQQVKWHFFILDGATTLANSKFWVKIQRPFVAGADIRDVTFIQTVRSK